MGPVGDAGPITARPHGRIRRDGGLEPQQLDRCAVNGHHSLPLGGDPVNEQAAAELGLEPRGLGGHEQAGVGDVDDGESGPRAVPEEGERR